jgi:hypothetical protein
MSAHELHIWEDEARSRQIKSLDSVKATAVTWSGFISTLTGFLGVVGITLSPESLGSLDSPFDILIKILIALAIVLNLAAIFYAILASQAIPQMIWSTGSSLKEAVESTVPKALKQLNTSQILTGILVFIILTLGLIVQFAPQKATKSSVIAVFKSGLVYCGTLSKTNFAGMKSLNSEKTTIELQDVAQIVLVKSCE